MLTTLYVICAVLGGTILACQFVLTLLGLGGESLGIDLPSGHDHLDVGGGFHAGDHVGHAHHDTATGGHDSSWFFGVLTFRTVVAALTFFGLAGLAANAGGMTQGGAVAVALAAGGGALYGVHWMMKSLYGLKADGTVRIESAIGQSGSVYLRIPANRSGAGKVQVLVQSRTMEYDAMTSGAELPTGARVVVVDVLNPDTVEVEPVNEPETAIPSSAHA